MRHYLAVAVIFLAFRQFKAELSESNKNVDGSVLKSDVRPYFDGEFSYQAKPGSVWEHLDVLDESPNSKRMWRVRPQVHKVGQRPLTGGQNPQQNIGQRPGARPPSQIKFPEGQRKPGTNPTVQVKPQAPSQTQLLPTSSQTFKPQIQSATAPLALTQQPSPAPQLTSPPLAVQNNAPNIVGGKEPGLLVDPNINLAELSIKLAYPPVDGIEPFIPVEIQKETTPSPVTDAPIFDVTSKKSPYQHMLTPPTNPSEPFANAHLPSLLPTIPQSPDPVLPIDDPHVISPPTPSQANTQKPQSHVIVRPISQPSPTAVPVVRPTAQSIPSQQVPPPTLPQASQTPSPQQSSGPFVPGEEILDNVPSTFDQHSTAHLPTRPPVLSTPPPPPQPKPVYVPLSQNLPTQQPSVQRPPSQLPAPQVPQYQTIPAQFATVTQKYPTGPPFVQPTPTQQPPAIQPSIQRPIIQSYPTQPPTIQTPPPYLAPVDQYPLYETVYTMVPPTPSPQPLKPIPTPGPTQRPPSILASGLLPDSTPVPIPTTDPIPTPTSEPAPAPTPEPALAPSLATTPAPTLPPTPEATLAPPPAPTKPDPITLEPTTPEPTTPESTTPEPTPAPTPPPPPLPKVTLRSGGELVGSTMQTVNGKPVDAYRGIPYAKPPVGNLRFRPPQPLSPWVGEKKALQDAPPCPQHHPLNSNITFGSEDCLYLNVYTPQNRTQNESLPVMVFFHGGGFNFGSSDSLLYGPDRLLAHDVILVTSNYRLGPLGFFSTGTLDCPGNNGLKDQVEVLKWVQANIGAFGGEPRNVTIFGQSSGAASVTYHMVSPKTEGLFSKAIVQSGTNYDCWALVQNRTAIYRAKRLRNLLNCATHGYWTGILECLRKKTADEIVSASAIFYSFGVEPITAFGPVVEPSHDDAYLTMMPRDIYRPHSVHIPLMIGVTAEEGVIKSGPLINLHDGPFRSKFKKVLPKLLYYDDWPQTIRQKITTRVDRLYFKNNHTWSKENHQDLTTLFSDRLFYSGVDQYLRNRFAQRNSTFGTTYAYLFDHKGPMSLSPQYGSGPEYYGVVHGDELPYLFSMNATHIPSVDNDTRFKWAMPRMWTHFAITGNPTPEDSPIRPWKEANKFKLRYAQLGSKNTTDMIVIRNIAGFMESKMRFWRKIQTDFLTEAKKPVILVLP